MAQATFEVQTFDGHGWVTRHRGADVDAAGEAARRVLPEARRHAVRIVKQSYDPVQQKLDNQVVFSLGQPRRRGVRRVIGVAAALALSAAAIAGATVLPQLAPDALAELADAMVEEAPAATAPEVALETLTPAAGAAIVVAAENGFDCRREAEAGFLRASNISPERDRLYGLCALAVDGDPAAQAELASSLAAGAGAAADPAQAVAWLQEAARAGHVEAYRPLADLLIDTDPARAVSWYHRAATGGDVAAALVLAARYRAGDGVAQDSRIALSYELMAADAGDASAMLSVAAAFEAGEGAEANADAAQRWRDRAAAAGVAQVDGVQAGGQPTLHWTPPGDDAATPQATWTAPALADGQAAGSVAQLLSVPALSLDIDQDAQEGFAAFAGQASV